VKGSGLDKLNSVCKHFLGMGKAKPGGAQMSDEPGEELIMTSSSSTKVEKAGFQRRVGGWL